MFIFQFYVAAPVNDEYVCILFKNLWFPSGIIWYKAVANKQAIEPMVPSGKGEIIAMKVLRCPSGLVHSLGDVYFLSQMTRVSFLCLTHNFVFCRCSWRITEYDFSPFCCSWRKTEYYFSPLCCSWCITEYDFSPFCCSWRITKYYFSPFFCCSRRLTEYCFSPFCCS